MFDTHAHLGFKEFDKDREEAIKRAFSNGVKKIINVGCDLETSKNSIELSNRYENIFAAIGIHPGEINEQKTINNEQIISELKKLAENKKVVAIGEIGLDYKNNSKLETKNSRPPRYAKHCGQAKPQLKTQNLQKEILKAQIELAQELNLPIIFHCRMAHNDLCEILNSKSEYRNPCPQMLCIKQCRRAKQIQNSNFQNSKLQGVIHCFTGNCQQAKKYLKMGFYLGFGGIIFRMNLNEIIKKIPLNRILIETDCPFLTPPLSDKNFEKIKTNRNEPAFVKYTVQKIAEIKKMSFQEIEKITTQNAEKLFGI